MEPLEEVPPESEMLIEGTESEPTEEMVQLIDGTWIEKVNQDQDTNICQQKKL